MTRAFNVCGLVVHVVPGSSTCFSERLKALPGVDVHAVDGDRLVVTAMDTPEAEALQQMTAINRLPGVVSTSLVYHQTDEAAARCGCASGSACCGDPASRDPASRDSCARP
ncbi:MAG: chaperone NapD [Alsobacter sp.]